MQLGILPDSKNLHARWSNASHTLQFLSNHVSGMYFFYALQVLKLHTCGQKMWSPSGKSN